MQPEILEALDAGSTTQADLSRRALDALFPSASRWWAWVRGSAAAALGVPTQAIQRASNKLAREAITDALMVLALPGRVLTLSAHLGDAYPEELMEPTDPELNALMARFEPVSPAVDNCGAHDWSDLTSGCTTSCTYFESSIWGSDSTSHRSLRARSRASPEA